MRVIEPRVTIDSHIDGVGICKAIEKAGRTCYKSEEKVTGDSYIKFIQMIMKRGHHSVLEHCSVDSVRFICDRGVTHEIVRHRLASYSQESTRYCNYSKGKFGEEITVIKPCFWSEDSDEYRCWKEAMYYAEKYYLDLIARGASPQEARSVLPNSLKTEIVMSCNIREWRHFFTLRTGEAAHPQMRQLTIPLLDEFKRKIPVLFDDIVPTEKARNWTGV